MDLTLTKVEGETIPVSTLTMSPAEKWKEQYDVPTKTIDGKLYASEIDAYYPVIGDPTTVDVEGLLLAGPDFDYVLEGEIVWNSREERWDYDFVKLFNEDGIEIKVEGEVEKALKEFTAL